MRPAFGLGPVLGELEIVARELRNRGPKRSVVHLAPAPRIVNLGTRNICLLAAGRGRGPARPGPAAPHSSFTPAALITLFQRSTSARI